MPGAVERAAKRDPRGGAAPTMLAGRLPRMRFSGRDLFRAAQSRLQLDAVTVFIALAWFVAVIAAILWTWGLDPQVTLMPDEVVNRLAAQLLRANGSLLMPLPFEDPEDLAHPRFWISVGDHAVPAYAPLAIYWFAFWLRFGKLGLVMILALPAGAVAAFAAGIAKLLPSDRRWLALTAPLLGGPALYWLMRPWMNVSPLLSCLCLAFFCWASWRRSNDPRWLSGAAAFVGGAVAVRPDYAVYLFVPALLVGLAAGAEHRKRVIVSILAAGSAAVAVNLLLNKWTTGDPLTAAYQIQLARNEGGDTEPRAGLARRLLGLLVQLLAPMGVPTIETALRFLGNYWFRLGSIAGLTLAQLALVPLLLRQPRSKQWLYGLALLVLVGFMLSRMDETLFGASTEVSSLDHSIPRYWSPIYLLAALPPILFLARAGTRAVVIAGSAALIWLSAANAYDICAGTRWSLVDLKRFREKKTALLDSLVRTIPEGAIVYTATHDKVLWQKWRVGTIDQPAATAKSIRRAFKAGNEVFVFEPAYPPQELKALSRALRRRGLALDAAGKRDLSHIVKRKKKRAR